MKHFVSKCIACALALSLLAGCSAKPATSGQPSAPAPASAAAGTAAPAANTPVTLKGWSAFAFTDTTGMKSYNDQLAWKQIEKNTGIRVEWTTVTTLNNNAPTQFGLLMASGNLPDFFVDINPLLYEEYGRKGALIQLESLIKSDIPNLDALLKSDPGARGSITSADGHIYFFPRLMNDVGARCWPGFMVRKDWLDKVGMQSPESIDDMYKVLKAFKEKIPTAKKPYTGDPKPFIWAFGVGTRGTGNVNDDTFVEDGKIKFGPSDPRYKDAMTFLNKLYAEGLLDPEWNGISGDQVTTNIVTDLSGASFGSFSGYLGKYNNLFKKDNKGEPLVAVAPLKGPSGKRATQGMHTSIDLGYGGAIASTSKKAKDVARLFNYTYSNDGIKNLYYGVEGDTYTLSNGTPKYTDKVVNSDLGVLGYGNNYIGNISCFPSNYLLSVYHSILTPEGIRGNKITTENAGSLKVPALRFSDTEIADVNSILRDLNTYVDQNAAAFISGQKKLSDWDSYVAGFSKLRVDDLLKIYNASYQRFLTASKG